MLLAVDDVCQNNGTLRKVMQIIFSRRIRRVKMKNEDSYLSTKNLKILERPIHKLNLIVENDVN